MFLQPIKSIGDFKVVARNISVGVPGNISVLVGHAYFMKGKKQVFLLMFTDYLREGEATL